MAQTRGNLFIFSASSDAGKSSLINLVWVSLFLLADMFICLTLSFEVM
jgi:guanylate kinase